MAHTITRIDGAELGVFIAKVEDFVTGVPTVVTSPVRSGTYAYRLLQNGAAAQAIILALSFRATDGRPSSTAFAAGAFRTYVRFASLPDTTRQILSLRGVGPTNRTVVSLTSGGVLSLDGTLGTSVLAINTWYQIRVLYDSVTGLVSLMLDDVLEFDDITAASAGTVFQLMLGQSIAAATYDMFVDDIVIEAAASVASIDFPESGSVLGLPLIADGIIDPSPATWGLLGAATRWEACTGPDDGDTTAIQVSNIGARFQMFLQTLVAGVNNEIQAAQFEHIVRQTSGQNWDHRLLIHSSDSATTLVLTALTSGSAGDGQSSYSHFRSVRQNSPFTGVPWTSEELSSMTVGVRVNPSGAVGIVRVSTVMTQVDVGDSPPPGEGVNSTFLGQAALITGPLRSVTNYVPEICTVKITSEHLGIPDEAFNIVSCSIRHVPSGMGVIRGVYFFDQLATQSFTLHNNPLQDDLLHDESALMGDPLRIESASSFVFNESEMVDGLQVYTEYVPIGSSGKYFELCLTQTGPQDMEILAINFHIELEGAREAYLDKEF